MKKFMIYLADGFTADQEEEIRRVLAKHQVRILPMGFSVDTKTIAAEMPNERESEVLSLPFVRDVIDCPDGNVKMNLCAA